jgi:translation initiation factor IF-1
MSREEHIEFDGHITEVLPAGLFRVEIHDNKHVVLAHLGGKLKMHKIRVVLGDNVRIAMTPYDPKRGIIVYRK